MSVYTNQTNANATTTFFGAGGGGSNFPNGINIGSNINSPLFLASGNIPDSVGPALGYISGLGGVNQGWLANPIWSGDAAGGYLKFGSTTMEAVDGAGINSSRFITSYPSAIGTTSVFGISNVSSISGTYTANNNYHTPLRLNLNPANANINDQIAMVVTYNPDDAGSTAIALGARGDGNAFVGAVWEGYITMPLDIWGQTIHMYSDNETFMFMDGKAGNIGSISTGVGFISGSNQFSSVMSADTQSVANMDALLSTLKSTYPQCFLP